MTDHCRIFRWVQLPAVSKTRGNAFTLVELLVVVAIIAIIMSLLLPVLRNARLAASSGRCLSNLHQIGLASNMYTTEFKGDFPMYAPWLRPTPLGFMVNDPRSGDFHPDFFRKQYLMTEWFKSGPYGAVPRGGDGFFGPYLNTGRDIDPTVAPKTPPAYIGLQFILGCPSEPLGPTTKSLTHPGSPAALRSAWRAFSYGVNLSGVFDWSDPWLPGNNALLLDGKMILMADSPGVSPYVVASWVPWEDMTQIAPALRHVEVFNAVFIDGHAKGGRLDPLYYDRQYWYSD